MSKELEREAIANLFIGLIPPTWGLKMENVKFEEPAHGRYCHLIQVPIFSDRMTMSVNHLERIISDIQLDCYVNLDGGTKDLNLLEDKLRTDIGERQITLPDGDLITFRRMKSKNFGQFYKKYRRALIFPIHRDVWR